MLTRLSLLVLAAFMFGCAILSPGS